MVSINALMATREPWRVLLRRKDSDWQFVPCQYDDKHDIWWGYARKSGSKGVYLVKRKGNEPIWIIIRSDVRPLPTSHEIRRVLCK